MNENNSRLRLGIVAIIAVSLFATLFARLWYLQVMATKEFQVAARANQQRVIVEEAPRGRILDRNGRVFVDNRISIVVTVDRQKLDELSKAERQRVLTRLSQELTRAGKPLTVPQIEDRLTDVRYSPYTPVPVAEDVPESLEIYLVEHQQEFTDAVAAQATTLRAYPLGRTGAHLLGYVGSINQTELDAHHNSPKTYQLGDEVGKTGVERVYEDVLRGTPGRRVLEVDANGKVIKELSNEPPKPGDDVVLTVDANVQAIAERALADELNAAHNRRNRDGSYNAAPAGSVVVLDPRNGSVVAMASYPDYNPAEFTQPIPTARWKQLQDPAGYYPLNNRAIQGQYAPGSTFKLLTAYAAMKSGAINADTTISDGGSYKLSSCTGETCVFHNSGGRAWGRVNLRRALTVSSDVFFYQLGARFWFDRGTFGDAIQSAAAQFGLGADTGIPLPSEQDGFIPTPEKKKQRHDQNPKAFPEGHWFAGDNVNMAIGQGDVLVTPLQLANAYAAFANGGTLFSPNIASEFRAAGTDRVLQKLAPRVLHKIDLPPTIRVPMLDGLVGVTTSPEGTAYGAFVGFPDGWQVAGKTGTAEVNNKSDTAVFAGFGPAAGPQYVGVAFLEESGFGARAAAPVVRRIFEGLANPAVRPTVGPGGRLSSPIPEGSDPGAAADTRG